MADDKNDGQSLADYAKAHGTGTSKFVIPKEPITNDSLNVRPNEGEAEEYHAQEKIKHAAGGAKLSGFTVAHAGEGEADITRQGKLLHEPEGAPAKPAEPDSSFLGGLKKAYADVKNNVEGVVGLADQLSGEAKGVQAKAQNVAQYKKGAPGM